MHLHAIAAKARTNHGKLSIYTVLNAIQVLLSLIFQIQFAKVFGTSNHADVYFVGAAMLVVFSSLSGILIEMFMQYYNDVKFRDKQSAAKFYQSVFNLTAMVGLSIYLLVLMFMQDAIHLFAPGFDVGRVGMLKSFFSIYGCNMILAGLITLNVSLLNAEMKFHIPYLLGVLPPAMNNLFLAIYGHDLGLRAIADSTLLSGMISLTVYQLYISRKLKLRPGRCLCHPELSKLIKSSICLRVGNQIWDLKDIITTNILSRYAAGTVSLYFYAWKIMQILYMITNSPIVKVFSAKLARSISENNIQEAKKALRSTFKLNTAFFAVIVFPFAAILPAALEFIFGSKFTVTDIRWIHHLFLSLIPFFMIVSIETLYTNFIVALKQSARIIMINSVFLAVFAASLYLLADAAGIYSIPISLALAQVTNLAAYVYSVARFLNSTEADVSTVEIE